jgi:hypothetical protein
MLLEVRLMASRAIPAFPNGLLTDSKTRARLSRWDDGEGLLEEFEPVLIAMDYRKDSITPDPCC